MKAYLLALAVAPLLASAGHATEYKVSQLNSGDEGSMVFEPSFIKVKPGDTVNVVAVDKGHNVESILAIAPAGTKAVKGAIGQDIVLHFDKAGLYGFKCTPHYGMGMVMIVQVGASPPNLAEAKAAALMGPPMAKKRLAAALAQAK